MSENKKSKILIVEDHQKIAEVWSEILNSQGYDVLGICSEEEQAINKAKESRPNIVLMDINLKQGNGLSCTKSLTALLPDCKVIALSMYNDLKHLEDMLNAGAVGYVTKNSSVKEILKAIEVVQEGGQYICKDMVEV
jgi:DNA-binding NarL/FixJ family response regulator